MTNVTQTDRPSQTERIESEIRRTRDRMGHDLEAIGDKFRPERIKQRAKEAMSRKGANMLRTAKENPLPTAIVALGLALLYRERGKQRESGDGYAAERGTGAERWTGKEEEGEGLKERAQELAGDAKSTAQNLVSTAGEKVGHAAEQVGAKAKRTGNTLQNFFQTNPIIAGAGVLVLGTVVGTLIPQTEKENKMMGQARDELVEQARGVAQHAQSTFEQKMSE